MAKRKKIILQNIFSSQELEQHVFHMTWAILDFLLTTPVPFRIISMTQIATVSSTY
jgi:hypothetical protein